MHTWATRAIVHKQASRQRRGRSCNRTCCLRLCTLPALHACGSHRSIVRYSLARALQEWCVYTWCVWYMRLDGGGGRACGEEEWGLWPAHANFAQFGRHQTETCWHSDLDCIQYKTSAWVQTSCVCSLSLQAYFQDTHTTTTPSDRRFRLINIKGVHMHVRACTFNVFYYRK